MRKIIIALALLATISAPAFAGRLCEATSAAGGHGVNVSANMNGSVGTAAGATVGVR